MLAVGGLVAWLLVRSHGQLVAASTAVRSASLVALVGCLLAIVACSANLAALEWRTQRLVGLERSFHETWRLTLGAHALDMASKSGGLAGATGFAADARGPGRSRERGAVVTALSIVGVLPGGLGFAEVSMGASLHAFGVDAGHALAAIAVYRLFDLWLPLTIGLASLRPAMTPGGN